VNQARALTLGVEWFRSRQPRCMGTLYWQLNDCWPGGTTWSCIDGDGRPKPLWYATRRFFQDYHATIQPEPDGSLSLYLIYDGDGQVVVDNMYVGRHSFDMKNCFASQRIDAVVPARSALRIPLDRVVATPGDPSGEFIHFGDEYRDAYWYFAPDKDIHYPPPRFRADLTHVKDDDTYYLNVEAQTFLRDVCVFVDRLDPDATISEQLVTLFPDQVHAFAIRSKRPLALEQLTSPAVFRCVNSFGRGI
jgi:beta-mannosidase